MNNRIEKVSIIIPVYNVENYIDQCLESVCSQTYRNLEIIIVCDDSPDNSLLKCKRWADKEKRIRLIISQQRKGLGAARNIGLRAATGKYIVYVDSDDWIEKNYIEILYRAIEKTQANYVSSTGFYEIRSENNINEYRTLPAGEYSSDSDRIIVLLKEAPAVWKKIYNREWLIMNKLFQPELFHYEDWGFDIALILQAERIVLIPEIGVFYRNEREGCLSNDSLEAQCLDFRKSIEFGLQQAEKVKILKKYRKTIQIYLLHDYYLRLNQAYVMQNERALQILGQIKSDVLVECLGYQDKHEQKRCICFGSFSLRWMVQRTIVFAPHLEYYGFSSIISALAQAEMTNVSNENKFRVHQVSQDILGKFGQTLDSIQEKTILFVDFLEERNSVLELKHDQYITKSEAYQESIVKSVCIENTIQSGEDRFIFLWQRKCQVMVEKLNLKKNLMDIILVKNRMALHYGNRNKIKEFIQRHNLNRINNMISEMEEYFLECCKQKDIYVKVFDLPEEYCFTDEKFRYGCEPQYMNEMLYTYLGFQMFSEICI